MTSRLTPVPKHIVSRGSLRKIAIVGTGISGLVCAYKLAPHHDISIFEKNDYIAGILIICLKENQKINVDTGFIVFNKKTYPNFLRLIENLGVNYKNGHEF